LANEGMSGVDIGGTSIRKGAVDAILVRVCAENRTKCAPSSAMLRSRSPCFSPSPAPRSSVPRAAGDVGTLLLDKTGTITLGNRQATEFIPMPGVAAQELPERTWWTVPPPRWWRWASGWHRTRSSDRRLGFASGAETDAAGAFGGLAIAESFGQQPHRAASVDESAITGESAPMIRESGGDRSAVTGGTRVLSDWIKVRITASPGSTFTTAAPLRHRAGGAGSLPCSAILAGRGRQALGGISRSL
jgi:hypothetical protein